MKPQYFLLLLFGSSMYWMYLLYKPFLLTFLIAALLAISTAKVQAYFTILTKSRLLGAIINTFLLAVLFFVPLGYFLTNLTLELNHLDPTIISKAIHTIKAFLIQPPQYLAFIKPYVGDIVSHIQLNNMASRALSLAGAVGVYSAGFLKNTFLIIIFYFFAQYYGEAIVKFTKKIIKFSDNESGLIIYELSSVMSTVFYSILATAILEGALFGIAVSYLGYNGLLYGIMYGFTSLIPVVGGVVMWLPFALYELSLGHTNEAVFISVYSIIIISVIADTFIKPIIIKEINTRLIRSNVELNELIIFFAIIAGLASFGFWGMILGPAITSFFLALIKLIEVKSNGIIE